MKTTKKKVITARKLLFCIIPLNIAYHNFKSFDRFVLQKFSNINETDEHPPTFVTQDTVKNVAIENNNEDKIRKEYLPVKDNSFNKTTKQNESTGTSGENNKDNNTRIPGKDPPIIEVTPKVVEIEETHKREETDANVDRRTPIESHKDGPIVVRDDSQQTYPFTFSGCLMVKDDNQLLPEWLAYHYTFLPLRHLIIAVDPLSYTRVEGVVDKFRSIGMKIMLITGNKYFADGGWSGSKFEYFDPKIHTREHQYDFLMQRQASFYNYCFRTFHKQGFNHTMILDSDEFFTFNQEWNKTYSYNESSPVGIPDVPTHVGKQNETLAHWIDSGADPIFSHFNSKEHEGCMVIPRVLVSSNESTSEEMSGYHHVEDGFNASYFDTFVFQKRGVIEFAGMQLGKSVVNLRHYRWNNCRNPHSSFPACFIIANGGALSNLPKAYSVHVHHNIGSYESYVNLNPLRSRETFDHRSAIFREFGIVVDSSKVGWLHEFIKLVGKEKALELTQTSRIAASMEDRAITERLRLNETVDFVYEWDEPKRDPRMNEWESLLFE